MLHGADGPPHRTPTDHRPHGPTLALLGHLDGLCGLLAVPHKRGGSASAVSAHTQLQRPSTSWAPLELMAPGSGGACCLNPPPAQNVAKMPRAKIPLAPRTWTQLKGGAFVGGHTRVLPPNWGDRPLLACLHDLSRQPCLLKKQPPPMSALFDFRSFVAVLLLTICTCTFIKSKGKSLLGTRFGTASSRLTPPSPPDPAAPSVLSERTG